MGCESRRGQQRLLRDNLSKKKKHGASPISYRLHAFVRAGEPAFFCILQIIFMKRNWNSLKKSEGIETVSI